MEHVLLIDDERFFARQYIRELELVFKVTLATSVMDGFRVFSQTSDLAAMILDIQMPTPESVEEYETAKGVDTGIWLLRKYREQFAARLIPIIILTNRKEEDIVQRTMGLGYPKAQIIIYRKVHVGPYDLPRKVMTMILRLRALQQENQSKGG